jgi:peptidoglycan/LPS O-acetylase OafA/YrhL
MTAPRRLQLDFIDGLRAAAALYIVVHHALQAADYFPGSLSYMGRGHDVVAVFIAISGFCLALPLAQRGSWNLRAGQFYQRRMRRILPPYYATVAIALLIALACSYKDYPQDYAGVPFSWAMLVSHLLLVQNWVLGQVYTLDGPLWSIAVECQIYVLFPLLVILWRRAGRWLALFVIFVLAHSLLYATHHGGSANFLFLFGEGMLGADLAFSERSRRWLGPATLLSFAGYCWCSLYPKYVVTDIFIGLSTALLMAYLTQHRHHWGNKLLGWKPLAWVGTFSYSLYLVHSFFQVPLKRWILARDIGHLAESHGTMALFMIVVVAPIAIAASYGFHVVFERPFMSPGRQKAEHRLAPELQPPGNLMGA